MPDLDVDILILCWNLWIIIMLAKMASQLNKRAVPKRTTLGKQRFLSSFSKFLSSNSYSVSSEVLHIDLLIDVEPRKSKRNSPKEPFRRRPLCKTEIFDFLYQFWRKYVSKFTFSRLKIFVTTFTRWEWLKKSKKTRGITYLVWQVKIQSKNSHSLLIWW